jgi:hypothetical protein
MARKLRRNLAMKACISGAGIVRDIGMSSGQTVIACSLVPSLDKKIRASGWKHGAAKEG